MNNDKSVTLHVPMHDYQDVDIKCISYMDSFVQKYLKQTYALSFNGGLDKIEKKHWEQMLGDLYAVYRTKWRSSIHQYQDVVDKQLPKFIDPLVKAVNEL